MNLFELAAKITLDSSGYDEGISKARGKMSTLAGHLGNGVKLAAKAGAAAISAAATGVTALTGMAVKGYAEYEQLTGGVETLFKESSDQVMEYAENAYKTAGMSANEYMETATGFAASLISSLGEKSQYAANYANIAITNMSDNANKMGTDIESIKNAYAGFAKQNFTMLDNLNKMGAFAV